VPVIAPYGTWVSPLSAADVAAGAVRLDLVELDGEAVYWLEGRPADEGRIALVRWTPDGRTVDLTPRGANVRTRVHEYGGGACLVRHGVAYYVEFADQRLYRLGTDGAPTALTAAGPWRYADADLHPSGRWLVCVREDHAPAGSPDGGEPGGAPAEPVNTLVRIALDAAPAPVPVQGPVQAPVQIPEADAGTVLVGGDDFYAAPRISPDGRRLCWISWRHPRMPWDGTELRVADLGDDGTVRNVRQVAGGDDESIHQPGWSPDGQLYFVSDRTGWWNLYREGAAGIEAVCPMGAEVGGPLWNFGPRAWAFLDSRRLLLVSTRAGVKRLHLVDVQSGEATPLTLPVEPGRLVAVSGSHAAFLGHSTHAPDAVVRLDLDTLALETLRTASSGGLYASFVSAPEAITFPTTGDREAHAFVYAPRNPEFRGPSTERPPLIVLSHGGPTSAAQTRLSLDIQFWTTRGFAVVDVDYGGSTGYGRAYRERLRSTWGQVDVDDCVAAAQHLVAQGRADGARLAIRGGSAGGYTTLAALTGRPEVFSAAASYYGICDLEVLARDTHKFEARYLDSLVGPYPAARATYVARSPIHAVDRLACPLIILQGEEDAVVPPNQARLMADAVRAKGLPVALVMFPGEQHGFRKTATIVRALEAELAFYGAVFGFPPADPIAPVPIDNLESWRARQTP